MATGGVVVQPRCSVCLDDYSMRRHPPKVLLCGHHFCSPCLEELYRVSEHQRVQCPTCRQVTSVNPKDISIATFLIPDNTQAISSNKRSMEQKMRQFESQQETESRCHSDIMEFCKKGDLFWSKMMDRKLKEREDVEKMLKILSDREEKRRLWQERFNECVQMNDLTDLEELEEDLNKFLRGSNEEMKTLQLSVVDDKVKENVVEFDCEVESVVVPGEMIVGEVGLKEDCDKVVNVDDLPWDLTVIDEGELLINGETVELPVIVVAFGQSYLSVMNKDGDKIHEIQLEEGSEIRYVTSIKNARKEALLAVSGWKSREVKIMDINGSIHQSNLLMSVPRGHCQLNLNQLAVACDYPSTFIQMLSLPGLKYLFNIQHPLLKGPASLTFHNDHLYVSNYYNEDNNNILVFNIGNNSSTTLQLQLSRPFSIISFHNYLFVSSFHQITQINISNNHKIIKQIGSEGQSNDQFNCPHGLSILHIDNQYYLVVGDFLNKRIKWHRIN